MSISTIILLFFIYSFMGWISEVIYCSLIERRFVNRGFLFGPLCPIYGFGGLLVISLLQPFSGNILYLFLMAVVVTSVLEYLSGWALETIFSTKWWDYSQYRFNIHGRVCLLNSVMFGLMGVAAVHFVHPAVMSFVGLFPPESRTALAAVLSSVLFLDFAFTLRTLVDFGEKLAGLTELMESVKGSLDFSEWFNEKDLRGSLERIRERARLDASDFNVRISARLEQVVLRAKSMQRLIRAFPGMTSKNHNAQLDVFKRLLDIGRSVKQDLTEAVPVQPTGIVEYLFAFLASSVLGTVIETLWFAGSGGPAVLRTALVVGYLNPVYGIAGVLLLVLYSRISLWRDLWVILASFAMLTAFSLVVDLLREAILYPVSLNAGSIASSIRALIHPLHTLALSVAAAFWIRDALPVLVGLFRKINRRVAGAAVLVLFLLAAADSLVSVAAVKRWADRSRGVEARTPAARLLDESFPDEALQERFQEQERFPAAENSER